MTTLDDLKSIFKIRWPNFTPEEVLSPDGLIMVHNKGVFPIQAVALDALQAFREQLNKPIIVNSGKHKRRGWRSPRENYVLNKGEFSFHVAGCAFDITVKDMPTKELKEEALKFGFGGVGLYETWIHIDTRFIINKTIQWKG